MAEIGFKNLKYKKMGDNEAETYTGDVKSLGKAISFKLTPSIENVELYADDGLAESSNEVAKCEIEVTIADLTQDVEAEIMGHTVDTTNGGVITKKGDEAPFIALYGIKTFSGGREKPFWLTKVKFSEAEESSTTKGEKLEFKTVTLKGTAYARLRDKVSKHSVFSDDPNYNATTYAAAPYELPTYSPVTSIALSESTKEVTVGATEQLSVTFTPTTATNQNVTWYSSDTTKATVDQTGLVKGIAAGTATITAVTNDGNKTSSCTVTVS